MPNQTSMRRVNFMLLAMIIAGFLFAMMLIYVYNAPEFFMSMQESLIVTAMALTSAFVGSAIVQWDVRRSYLRGLVERLAAAGLAGFMFWVEILIIAVVFEMSDELRGAGSFGSMLFFGQLMFIPTFVAMGVIELGRLFFDPVRKRQ